MLWQILHPIPPMYLFLSRPSQPLSMSFGLQRKPVERDGSLQGFNKSSFLHTQGGRVGKRVVEGEERRVLQGRKPLPNDLDGHLLCQGCPILPVILVKGIFNGHHWKEIKEGNLFYVLQSSLSKTDTLRDQPLMIDCPSQKWCLLDRVDCISVTILVKMLGVFCGTSFQMKIAIHCILICWV